MISLLVTNIGDKIIGDNFLIWVKALIYDPYIISISLHDIILIVPTNFWLKMTFIFIDGSGLDFSKQITLWDTFIKVVRDIISDAWNTLIKN